MLKKTRKYVIHKYIYEKYFRTQKRCYVKSSRVLEPPARDARCVPDTACGPELCRQQAGAVPAFLKLVTRRGAIAAREVAGHRWELTGKDQRRRQEFEQIRGGFTESGPEGLSVHVTGEFSKSNDCE